MYEPDAYISIPAPRVGSDGHDFRLSARADAISIPAPRVGSDVLSQSKTIMAQAFQSPLPAWGATVLPDSLVGKNLFQSPLPAWGATAKTNKSLLLTQSNFIDLPDFV